ncbi:MAG: signal peptidase I [Clostridia bacterium]|nr:signal peptidase I [Clostridia bacterium]
MDNNKVKKNKSTAKKVWDVISTILVILYTIIVLFVAVSVFSSRLTGTGQAAVLGYTFLYVETDSMQTDKPDSINVGDFVICKQDKNDFKDLEIGEVIAYREMQQKQDPITKEPIGEPFEVVKLHRIVGYDGDLYMTKGDKDGLEVDPVSVNPYRIVGVYTGTRVPYVGFVFDFVKSPTGIMICMVLPMAAFFIYALYKFVKAMIEYKMSKDPSLGTELSDEQKQAAIAEYLAKQANEAEANKDENNTDSKSE